MAIKKTLNTESQDLPTAIDENQRELGYYSVTSSLNGKQNIFPSNGNTQKRNIIVTGTDTGFTIEFRNSQSGFVGSAWTYGQRRTVYNDSTQDITVQDQNTNFSITLAPGRVCEVICLDPGLVTVFGVSIQDNYNVGADIDAATYDVLPYQKRINQSHSSTAASTLTFPDECKDINWGGCLVFDKGNNAGTNNITLEDSTPSTFATISTNGGSYYVWYDGTSFQVR